jgi:anti-anti-sigma factor
MSSVNHLTLNIEPDREVVHVRPTGELDVATVPSVEAELQGLFDRGFRHIVLDLRALEFADSAAVHLALRWDLRAREDGFELRLVAGPCPVQRVFEVTGMASLLPFAEPEPGWPPVPEQG